ncbi:hypothetical protein ACVNNN_03380 [Lysinibacillus fusiformis]|uniref:hypothetical protein n=1 Tax=Lysinibacillus sp. PWR01 TaxID=3342384 RepID=UPI00372CEB76
MNIVTFIPISNVVDTEAFLEYELFILDTAIIEGEMHDFSYSNTAIIPGIHTYVTMTKGERKDKNLMEILLNLK